jgi:hypothetical protein
MSGYAVGHVLRTSRSSGTSLLVLIVIAEATHQDGTGAWPGISSIAQLARTTERTVYRVIRNLERAGELLIERGAGPHGTNLYAIPGVGQLRFGDDAGVTPDKVSPLTRGASGDDTRVTPPLTTGASGDDTAVSPEPSIPVRDPSKNLSRAERAPAIEIPTRPLTQAQIEREQHAFGREAERVWLETAEKRGSSYTDRAALRIVHELAIKATRWASEAQVLAAIRRRLDVKSTPRRIPEWARLEQGDDAQREHAARAAERPADEIIEPRSRELRPIGAGVARVLARVAS